jgi:branched-chain amino acid transport system substrate-binding protein
LALILSIAGVGVRVKSFLTACGLIGLIALPACAPSRVPPPSLATQPEEQAALPADAAVRVGLLLPLSGPAQLLGQDMLRAAEMALFDVGANDVVLLPRDTGGTAEGAGRAAEGVIAEGARLILGPLFSQAVDAVTPLAERADVRVLAFSNSAAVAEPPTFILGFRPEEQVKRVVDYALGQGLSRIAALAPDDPYGRTAMGALQEAVTRGGGELGATMYYPPELADPSDVVREVAGYSERKAALEREKARVQGEPDAAARRRELETLDTFGPPPFDAILIADGASRLRSVAALLAFFDVSPDNARFLGTMRWQDDPQVLEEDALQGSWFAGPAPAKMTAFHERFQRTFGLPPQQLAALAYDATALAVIAARDLRDTEFTALTLTNPQGFAGATGLFRLRPDGLGEHGLAILEVRGEATVTIDPPPERFDDRLVSTPPSGAEPPQGEPVPGVRTTTSPIAPPGAPPVPGASGPPATISTS